MHRASHSQPRTNGYHRGPAENGSVGILADALFARFLDDVAERLKASDDQPTVDRALDELFGALAERKRQSTPPDWASFVAMCRGHAVLESLHMDPFTARAFHKPRGYPGDAVMMDYIYGHDEQWPAPPATPLGRRIFNFTTLAPASEGVRARRAFIASYIDRLAEATRRPSILSIAAGHLREAGASLAVRRRRFGKFVALDVDSESLAEVQRCYAAYGIETVTTSFRRLLDRSQSAGEFDLVYSLGLFDYLNQRTARRLVSSMFQMVRPGGQLLLANFLPEIRDIGYMETFMDWWLVYRSRSEMVDLTAEIPESDVNRVALFPEEQRNIIFLQLTRAAAYSL